MQAIRPCFSTFVNFSPLNLVNIYSASLQYGRHPPRSGSDLTKIDRGTLLTTSPSVCLWKIYYPYVSFSPSLGILIITARQQAYVECGIVLKLRVRDGHYPACVIRRKLAQFPEAGLPSSQAWRSMGRFQRLRSNHACPSPQSSIRRAIRISSIRA